jgi:hypothetical protein
MEATMKTSTKFFFILIASASGILACNLGRVVSDVQGRINEIERGSGNVVEETRSVQGFNSIDLAGFGQVIVEFGSEEALRIEAEDNLIGLIQTRVQNGTLVIEGDEDVTVIPTEPVRIFVTAIDLESITVSGAGDFQMPEFETASFQILITGLGNFTLEGITAEALTVGIDGSGNVSIEDGQVVEQTVTIDGFGNYDAGDLESEIASVEIRGAGDATVWVTESLEASLAGVGNISYYGSPELTVDRSGLGDIDPLGNK